MVTIHTCYKDTEGNICPLSVEVDITPGLGIHIIGIHDSYVKETLLRSITAMQNCGYRIPGKKIVIKVVPAQSFPCNIDLAVALGILIESGQGGFFNPFKKTLVYGELALSGAILNPNDGEISPIALRRWAQRNGYDNIVTCDSDYATMYRNCGMLGFDMLYRIVEHINRDARI